MLHPNGDDDDDVLYPFSPYLYGDDDGGGDGDGGQGEEEVAKGMDEANIHIPLLHNVYSDSHYMYLFWN